MKKLKFIGTLLKGLYSKLTGIMIASIIYVALNLVSPLLFSFLIDNVINQSEIKNSIMEGIFRMMGGAQGAAYIRENLWFGALIVIIIYLFICIAVYFRSKWNAIVAEGFAMKLRNKLFKHLSLLPYSYHVSAKSGDLIQRCTSDVDQIRRVFAGQIAELVYAIATTMIATAILFNIYTPLAWIAIVGMPFIFFFALFFFVKMQNAFQASDEAEGEMTTVINENLSATRVVKAFNRERYEVEQFEKKNRNYKKKTFRLLELLGMYWGISDFICYAQILAVIVFGIFYAQAGEITIGNFFVFITYESLILFPLRNVGRILADIGKVGVSVGRLLEILDVPVEDIETGIEPNLQGDIVFDHVSFKYDDGENLILDDISFKIEQGQTVAIMGPTGSGKSSLVHLLTRLYDYQKGSITVNQTEIKEIQKKYLRKNVGIVLQEPFLFSKTIYENIRLANQHADRIEVEEAARIASVADVIDEFERGYETLVGEKGVTLSGGQKQRIAIARTVINNSPILIFDDSLSAVDTQTDAQIRDAIQNLSKEITTLIITQRVASSEHADKIIVLTDGKIVQEGTHQELLQQEGLYQRVHEIQSRMTWEAGDTYE